MITELDTQVGRIVAALKQKNMLDNTLIIFSSDNGGATSALFATGARSPEEREESGGVGLEQKPPASNGEFRGGKGSLHEGGVRVPTIFYWPAKLKPRIVNEPLGMVDVMPTVLALAGAKGSPDHPFDGKDIWPTLAEGEPSPHEDILINVEAFRGAIRKGNWKLVKIALLPGKTELFDLSKDPGEQNNVADQFPEIAARSGGASHRLRERDEAERMDQGATGLPRRARQDDLRSGFRHRRCGLPHEKR